MWHRVCFRFNTIVHNIYHHQDIGQRIQIFKTINLEDITTSIASLSVQNPQFLREAKAKQILQYVKTHQMPNNIRILHALAHIQYNAFMSYVDTLLRFRHQTAQQQVEFVRDMREVAIEEGSHFNLLKNRLVQLGYDYGCMPVIPKLSHAIRETEKSLIERIGVISLMHEGRGVKAVEKLLHQLNQINDHKSIEVVKVIQNDQHKHFQMGWKWFFKICQLKQLNVSQQINNINLKYKCSISIPTPKKITNQFDI